MDALTAALDRHVSQPDDDLDEIPANIATRMQADKIANLREVADELPSDAEWACRHAAELRATADELAADAAALDADEMTFEEWATHWNVVDGELMTA